MTISLAQLQALRRQSGIAPPPPAQQPVRAESLEQQVERLRQLLRVKRPPAKAILADKDRTLPGEELAPGLWLRETRHSLDPGWPLELDGRFDRRESMRASDLMFFDTETTGLAGGTGTRAFMIGAADLHGAGLRVRQLTITSTAAEPLMLDEFRKWLIPSTVLVSYNGKSYDSPLLKTRYRLMRQSEPLSALSHLDLLYATRRRYRGVFENCRLATIERQALGIVREDDLPGSEAPGAWLGYLRGGSAQLLRRVIEHNHQDVVTLACLARHLGAELSSG